jgi:hypothetical protein
MQDQQFWGLKRIGRDRTASAGQPRFDSCSRTVKAEEQGQKSLKEKIKYCKYLTVIIGQMLEGSHGRTAMTRQQNARGRVRAAGTAAAGQLERKDFNIARIFMTFSR